MASIQYYDVILKPLVTEKSMAGMAEKRYCFLVHPEANKTMIKEAVEKMFAGAKVKSVNTMNRPTKTKRRGVTSVRLQRARRRLCSSPRTPRKSRSSRVCKASNYAV